jgi:4-amino-4-deoxy-L-arabinose transferase-like glycosyltransferase
MDQVYRFAILKGHHLLSGIAWERLTRSKYFWLTGLSIIAATVLKILLLVNDTIPFNADEAIVALMARHILNGERPLFFYGQAYMGSLDAWLIAAGFAIFGAHVWVVRFVQLLLYMLLLASTAWLGRLVFGSWKTGMIAVWLLAIPTVNVTLYTTASLGGYGEALLVGNLILIVGLMLLEHFDLDQKLPLFLCLIFGGLIGLGFWITGLTIVYSLPTLIYLGISVWRYRYKNPGMPINWKVLVLSGLAATLGVVAGSAPWWMFAFIQGIGNPLLELSGSAIAGVEGLSWISQIGQHLISFLLLGVSVIIGIRPPWGIQWLGLPAIPFIIFFWITVIVYAIKPSGDRARGHPRDLLMGVMLTTIAGFILTPFGADPSGRYFLPLAVPLALLAADFIVAIASRVGNWAWVLAGFVILYNLVGTLQTATRMPPGITTQFDPVTQIDQRQILKLTSFLRENDERYGYTNYWVSYPLAFLSQESLVFIPALPYHQDFRYTARDNRYPPYNNEVAHSNKVAYITTNHPALDERLRRQFEQAGLSWKERRIGDYQVFYSLSKPIRPEEIGLGATTP